MKGFFNVKKKSIRVLAAQLITDFALARHHRRDNFIFIHINKTGGSSIEKALKLPLDHKTVKEKMQELTAIQWKEKYKFAVVRNPWDKVVSHYAYRVQTNQTDLKSHPVDFRTWVRLAYRDQNPQYYDKPKMFMPQLDWLTDGNGHILVDFICRFENLTDDFALVLQRIGRKANLPHLKGSKRGDYREYFDDEAAEIVADWFQKDIDYFDYHF